MWMSYLIETVVCAQVQDLTMCCKMMVRRHKWNQVSSREQMRNLAVLLAIDDQAPLLADSDSLVHPTLANP